VSLGFVTPDWRHIVRLPPLSLFPGEGGVAAAGIAIDPATGDIWLSEFYRKRIGRLRKVPEQFATVSGDLLPSLTWSSTSIPKDFKVHQNLPNPFNAATVIQYNLPQPVKVKIEVLNILGQKVRTLVDEFQQAGYKSTVWDGKDNSGADVASGVYFYCVESADDVSVKRMTLIR